MANTLYDLLEVSQSASDDAIAAGYKRLHQQFSELAASGDEDATNRMIALREAFNTLSNPTRRQRYDTNLGARETADETTQTPGRPFIKLIVIACVIGFFGITYKKYQTAQELARLDAERTVAAAQMAESEARKAAEERIAAERADQQRQRNEAMERANRERDIAYGNQVSRNIERSEAESRRAMQREEQAKATAERQREYEAERQLAREKAYLRQIEAEKNRYRY
ncbi:DnaJ domain-containing protein [Azonexus sp. IMCC34842]|uniref:DnaJ domain-containing protein n=1 Tax=Azonexaceae TaxID=2008795 RepID=UPI001CF82F87|nr:DnaJ domain-containing protein [Dechloromonas denitrificans]UCV03683.1 DnaJ domain-containing protein [Dechloromonas denitrificans]